jgi:putative NADH-flavin reductase
MKLTIFGATGGIGTQLLAQAATAGHLATAAARNPARVAGAARIVAVDLAAPDRRALESAVAGADAVLSALGPRSATDAGVVSGGTRAILEAMLTTGVRRLVVVSAAPVGTTPSPDRPAPPRRDPGDTFLMRHVLSPLVKRVFGKGYADLAVMEDLVRLSDAEWTIVRPPRLTDRPLTGVYRTAYDRNVRRGLSISRADLAHLMLRLLDEPESIRHTVGVAR